MIRNNLRFAVKIFVQGHYHFTGMIIMWLGFSGHPVNKFAT